MVWVGGLLLLQNDNIPDECPTIDTPVETKIPTKAEKPFTTNLQSSLHLFITGGVLPYSFTYRNNDATWGRQICSDKVANLMSKGGDFS